MVKEKACGEPLTQGKVNEFHDSEGNVAKMAGWYYREIDVASAIRWLKEELKKGIQEDIDDREKGKLTGNYANGLAESLSLIDEAFPDFRKRNYLSAKE